MTASLRDMYSGATRYHQFLERRMGSDLAVSSPGMWFDFLWLQRRSSMDWLQIAVVQRITSTAHGHYLVDLERPWVIRGQRVVDCQAAQRARPALGLEPGAELPAKVAVGVARVLLARHLPRAALPRCWGRSKDGAGRHMPQGHHRAHAQPTYTAHRHCLSLPTTATDSGASGKFPRQPEKAPHP